MEFEGVHQSRHKDSTLGVASRFCRLQPCEYEKESDWPTSFRFATWASFSIFWDSCQCNILLWDLCPQCLCANNQSKQSKLNCLLMLVCFSSASGASHPQQQRAVPWPLGVVGEHAVVSPEPPSRLRHPCAVCLFPPRPDMSRTRPVTDPLRE